MGWFGGALAPPDTAPTPVGAHVLWHEPPTWSVGATVRLARASGGRRLAVFGLCGAVDDELNRLVEQAGTRELDVAATAWTGAYAIALDDGKGAFTLWGDPAGACPLYLARAHGVLLWSSSSLALASLLGSSPDRGWLAAHLADPTAWTPGRSAWADVEQLPPGHRWTISPNGASACVPYWEPSPGTRGASVRRLRDDLANSVLIRATGRAISSDLSGGLDSSTLAAHAAQHGPVLGVTHHPRGRERGGDIDHAREVVRAYPSIQHHLMPLGREHLPFTDLGTLVLTDEPAPSSITVAQLFSEFVLLKSEGTEVHLTGDGGDSLFLPPPVHLADLVRAGRLLRLGSDARSWARLHRTSPWPALAAAWRNPDRLAGTADPKPWLTSDALDLADAVISSCPHGKLLGHADRHLLAECRYVGRTAATENQLAAAFGIEMHNPFTDARILESVLAVPADARWSAHRYKPLLADAVRGLLPDSVIRRGAKGLFAMDHHHGLRANLNHVLNLADGYLADLGLVRPAALRSLLRRGALGIDIPWGLIEPVLGAELWLRASGTATQLVRWEAKP
ncbi:albusnodin/ikarugamycin family macrolactam cyclase [Streptomyces qinzhouensis]|uniref:asparagine synthase (glutamine-hydrolyzing) n=1 Tax=Streptomyces qinzhouensis TaxID=2599401 RepID=A0A5B8J5L8_9ACTN|nr:albusnodin/ikarugamycin family macrolactam cyclase [Streptomyces qinzhouensis]QDY77095.1 albusnodin/ikarugamycin family macrolactam cyclase [Streptomyces qinzhouensis]